MNSKTSFLQGLAWAVSVILHPIFLYTWLVFLVTVFFPDLLVPIAITGFNSLILVTFISTAIVPTLLVALWMVLVRKSQHLEAMFMQRKEDRQVPIVFLAAYYASLCYVLLMGLNNVLYLLLVAIVAVILVVGIVNYFWKISNHSAGMGAALGIMLTLNFADSKQELLIPILVITIVSGLVLSARLFLKAHNPKEVYMGYFAGFFTTVTAMLAFYYFQ